MKTLLAVAVLLASSVALACWSDFDCEYGQKCRKAQYQTTGECVQLVRDPYSRLPVYVPPDGSSVGPGRRKGNCMFDTQCDMVNEYCRVPDGEIYGFCTLK